MNKTALALATLLATSQCYATDKKDVLNHYADLAYTMYNDSLITAKTLQASLETLTKKPNDKTLAAARSAWKAARVPYQQTEVYRFGNTIVDDWEGKVNAWPLDEGLIDYVTVEYGEKSEENPLYTSNVIANPTLTLSGKKIDASKINSELLTDTLHEIGGIEANVATGYHAIEFLLWGQDLNGTNAGAGNRPATDFNVKNCTNGNCERRNEYLLAASRLLVDDLVWMTNQWKTDGAARATVLADINAGMNSIITGMGSLSYGELAGERIKLGLLLHDPEEEHDCFSDNTHYSHYYDILGIKNVYTGTYITIEGKELTGPSLLSLVAEKDKDAARDLNNAIDSSLAAAKVLVDSAEKEGIAYDQLIAEGNEIGNAKVMNVVENLLNQTKAIEVATQKLGLEKIEFEGSDSLDSPSSVFQ